MRDAGSLQRLADMGIEVWQLRSSTSVSQSLASQSDPATGQPRIRLSSGDGDWLLVRRQPWRGSHEQLVADIMATIGPERCRFGQWSNDSTSGEGLDELLARGVRHILCFGRPTEAPEWSQLLIAPSLDELAGQADARRALWQLMVREIGQ
jgi:hypothetical protein